MLQIVSCAPKNLMPYCAPPVPDNYSQCGFKLTLNQVHTFTLPLCVAMHVYALITSGVVLNPARFLAVAGGSTPPTLLSNWRRRV